MLVFPAVPCPSTCTRAARRENARRGVPTRGEDRGVTTQVRTQLFPLCPRRSPRAASGWPNSEGKLGLRQTQYRIGLRPLAQEVLGNLVELVGIEPTTSSLRTMRSP